MKLFRCCTIAAIVFFCSNTFASENDSTVATPPSDTVVQSDTVAQSDTLAQSATVSPVDSLSAAEAFAAFSVRQKKYLKTSIITNVLYAGGFGIYYGVVLPRSNMVNFNSMDVLKLMPLTYLSVGMMYASLPIGIVSSHRAKKNYEYYYKTAPRNITLPLTFTGAGLSICAGGVQAYNLVKDYRDNNEIDGSYSKYQKAATALLTSGLVTFAGTNLYALAYNIILGEKAKRRSSSGSGKSVSSKSVSLAPFRLDDANGCLLTWNF